MDLSKWALKNQNLIYFLVAVLIVGGIFGAYQMSKLEDPEIKVKTAVVATIYPGASAHQVELEVTDILEKKIRTMGNINSIESYSYNDLSIITVELLTTVKNEDVEQCWDMLRRRVSDARLSLPSGCREPMVQDDFGNVYGIFYALTGDVPPEILGKYADLFKREIETVENVDRVNIYGKHNEQITISLLQDRMANLGVTPLEVLATLNNQNQTTYSGYFLNGDNRIRVSVDDKFRTTEDIGMMIIQGHDDDQLRLYDIADIVREEEDPLRNELLYNDQPAIGILVAATSGSDILKVGSAIEDRLHDLESRIPTGVEYKKVFFQPERVSSALSTFALNLIESVAIVVFVLMLAMGFRSGMIIGVSLIITVAGSLMFLYMLDGTVQRVSLGAFILAMGMLVDNAIVIIDGIVVDLKAGKKRQKALTAIGKQTGIPLLGATLIAIIAFLPIFLSPDTAGLYTRDLFIVLAISLLLSWILALVFVPIMASKRLFVSPVENTENGEKYNGVFYEYLRKILNFGLSHRLTFTLIMVALLALSGFGYFFMRQGFFPDMVYDQLYMEYKLPEGNNASRVKADLKEIADLLHQKEEITNITTSIGGTPGRYNLVRSIATPSLAYGELIIDFTSPEALVDNIELLQNEIAEKYPDAYVKFKPYNLMFKKYPIEAVFTGPDPAVLKALADSARAVMNASDYVRLITCDWEPEVPLLNIHYDQPSARRVGLSRSDVGLSLLTATDGIPIGSFYEGTESRSIVLKCLSEKGENIEDLSNAQIFSQMPDIAGLLDRDLMIKMMSGNIDRDEIFSRMMGSTPLAQVSDIEIKWENPVIPRFDGQRSIRVQCSPIAGLETEKARQTIASAIENISLPDGYELSWQGEKKASDQSMKYLFNNFPLAIIMMIAILILLFKDYRKPAVIFCCIPFVIVGVVAVMLLTGKTFNFVAIVGTLGLMGMLVKNGIVLMDEISLQISAGIDPRKALIDSSQSRFLPVMMASLTTILGMIPLLPDAMFGSLAASIMGGLLFASIITLLFIPVLYSLFFKIK